MFRVIANLVLLTLLGVGATAQELPVKQFHRHTFSSTEPAEVLHEVQNQIISIYGEDISPVLDTVISSMVATHYTYSIYAGGYPLHTLQLKVSIPHNSSSSAPALLAPDIDLSGLSKSPDNQLVTSPKIIYHSNQDSSTTREVKWVLAHQGWQLATVEKSQTRSGIAERWIDSSGELIRSIDLAVYNKPDSMVSTYVFLPDPLTSAEVTYGGDYIDDLDNDSPALNDQRISVMQSVRWDSIAGLWTLASDYCKIVDLFDPPKAPATSPNADFEFTRSQDGFEDVNAFYHINRQQAYIQSLGFTNLMNQQLSVDAHGEGGADQSSFTEGINNPVIQFGEGGVDDAEDADVIVHEYGHALVYSAAPGSNAGTARNSIDEGICDYLAATYSDQFSSFGTHQVFDWDGHNEFWPGRVVDVERTYPNDITENIYTDGEMWASTLIEISGVLGRTLTDSILFNSTYDYVALMDYTTAANLLLRADTLLTGGANADTISYFLCKRGYLSGCEDTIADDDTFETPKLLNTDGFTFNDELLTLDPGSTTVKGVWCTNLSGQVVWYESFNDADLPISLTLNELQRGLFIVSVLTNTGKYAFKILKL